jgi:predicted TIM-barrel fold metal-dependent hydrolase
MIIDSDCHISPFEKKDRISYLELLRRMDRSKVDKAVIWLQPDYFRDMLEGNRYVFKACKDYPDRFIGFGWIDPHVGSTKSKDEIFKCFDDYGFVGVKLNGAQNEFKIDDPQLSWPLIETIAGSGKILAFHIGADSFENTHPFRLVKIAKAFPEVVILAVHMGGAATPDFSSSVIELCGNYTNIFFVASSIKPAAVLSAINDVSPSRVLFGSDTPFGMMHVEIAKYNALLEDLPVKEKELVMGGNLKRILQIK